MKVQFMKEGLHKCDSVAYCKFTQHDISPCMVQFRGPTAAKI